nr:hypothetical protein [Microctonus hyperodae filamentous virus]
MPLTVAERKRLQRARDAADPDRRNRKLTTMFMFGCVDIAIIIDICGEIWFRGVDLARALEMKNPSTAISENIEDEYIKSYQNIIFALGEDCDIGSFQPKTTFVNEMGMNLFLVRSRMPKAVSFVKWVCGQVLPSIRRTGHYQIAEENNPYKELNDYLKQQIEQKDATIQARNVTIEAKDNLMLQMTTKLLTLQESAVLPNAHEIKDEYVVIYRKFDLARRAEITKLDTLMFPYYGCRVQMDNLLLRKNELELMYPQLEELVRLKVPNSVNFFNYMFDEMKNVIERGCNKSLITSFRIRNDDLCAAEDAVMTQIINMYRGKYGNKNIMYKGVELL